MLTKTLKAHLQCIKTLNEEPHGRTGYFLVLISNQVWSWKEILSVQFLNRGNRYLSEEHSEAHNALVLSTTLIRRWRQLRQMTVASFLNLHISLSIFLSLLHSLWPIPVSYMLAPPADRRLIYLTQGFTVWSSISRHYNL